MSRTFRRKGDKKRNKSGRANSIYDYIHESSYRFGLVGNTYRMLGQVKRELLEGHEFYKGYWKYHGDSSNGYGWSNPIGVRRSWERVTRRRNKQEIIRYIKDNDYEVMLHKPLCLSWER